MDGRHEFAMERSHLMPINTLPHSGFTMNQNFESQSTGSNTMLRQSLSELGQSGTQPVNGPMSFQGRFFSPTISLSASPPFPFMSNLLGNSSPAVSADHFKNGMPTQFWSHTAEGYPRFGLPGVLPPLYSVGAMLSADEVGPHYSQTRTSQSQPIYHRSNLYDTHKDLGLCAQNMTIGTSLAASGHNITGLNLAKGELGQQERKNDRKQNHKYENEFKKSQDKNERKHKMEGDFKRMEEVGKCQNEERKKKNHVIPEKRHMVFNTASDAHNQSGHSLHGKSVIPLAPNTFSKGFNCDSHPKNCLIASRIEKSVSAETVQPIPSFGGNPEKKITSLSDNIGNLDDFHLSNSRSQNKEIFSVSSNYSMEPPDKSSEKISSGTMSKLEESSGRPGEEAILVINDTKNSQNRNFADSSLHYVYDWSHDRNSNYASSHMVALAAQHGYIPPHPSQQKKNSMTQDSTTPIFPLRKDRVSPHRSDKSSTCRSKESSAIRNKPLKKECDNMKSQNENAKTNNKNEDHRQSTPSELVLPNFSSQANGTSSIPIGIAVARQRQEHNASQNSERRPDSLQDDRLRLRTDMRQSSELRQREEFVRDHKELLTVQKMPSVPSSHDLNSNFMVLGAGVGHPNLPTASQWDNQATTVRTHIPPQWVQTSHVSPAFWLGRSPYSSTMPIHQSGSLDAAHIPLTQGGYQIARDPISGHFLLLANLDIVERHSVWPAYSAVPPHLQHSHQLQQLMAQQQQNQLQQQLLQKQQQQQERQRSMEYGMNQQMLQQLSQQDRRKYSSTSVESNRPEKKIESIKVNPVPDPPQSHLSETVFITHPPDIQDKCETKENSAPSVISGLPLPHGQSYHYAYSPHPSPFPYFYDSANVMPLSAIVPVSESLMQGKDSTKRSQGTSPVTTPQENTELVQCPSPEPELEQSKMEKLEEENDISTVSQGVSTGDDLLEDEAIMTKEIATETGYETSSKPEAIIIRESMVDKMTETAPVLKEEILEQEFSSYEETEPPKIDIQVTSEIPDEPSPIGNKNEAEIEEPKEAELMSSEKNVELSVLKILTESTEGEVPPETNQTTEDSSSPLPPLLVKEPSCMTLYDGIEQILQVADGLSLLCTLAEQRILEESLKTNNLVNSTSKEIKQSEEISFSQTKTKSCSSEKCTKSKILIDSKIPNFKIDKTCIGQYTVGGYRIPPGAEGMDAMELEMRLRLAELQRKYKEKQKELARLQPKKERLMLGLLSSEHDKSPNKRGPGRPRKRKFFSMLKSCQPEKVEIGKSSKSRSGSFLIHSCHRDSVKKRKKLLKDSRLFVSHLIKKSKVSSKIIKAKKLKMSSALLRCRKNSVSSSTTDSSSCKSLSEIPLSKLSFSKKLCSRSEDKNSKSKKSSSLDRNIQDRNKSNIKKEKIKMSMKTNDEDSERENISWLFEKDKVNSIWSSTPKIKTKDKSSRIKMKDSSKKSKKIASTSSVILRPITPPLPPILQPLFPSDHSNDTNEYEETSGLGLLAKYAMCVAAQLKINKPSKIESENLDNEISPAKKRKPGRPKKHMIKAEATETIVSKQSKNYTLMKMKALVEENSNKKSKLKSESKSQSDSICFPYLEDVSWNRRRSERIFLNETSPSPAIETSRGLLASPQLKSSVTHSSSSPVPSSSCSSSAMKMKTEDISKFSSKSFHKEERSQIKKKLSKPKLDCDHKRRKSKDSKKRPQLPSSSRKESLNKSSHVEDIYCGTLKENSRYYESILDSDSTDTSSFSEGENVPLSTLIERPMTPEPRSCAISKEELREGLRVLILVDGLFYAGYVNAIQAPDVYGVTLDGERGNRPHIYSREEILSEAIIEVKPTSTRFLTEGTRICAYWSQQYRCLYPGTISKSNMSPFCDKFLLNVEFDDGDSGRISLEDIRMLPTDYPIVAVDTSPIMLLGKRRRRTSEDTSSDMPRINEPNKRIKRGRKQMKPIKKVSACQEPEGNGLTMEEFHVLAEEMGENDVFEEPPLLAQFSPTKTTTSKQDETQLIKKKTISGTHNNLTLDSSRKKIKSKKKNSKCDKNGKSDSSTKSRHPKKHKDRSDDHKHHHHHHKKHKHDKRSEDNFHILGTSNNEAKKIDITVKIRTNSTDTAPRELAGATRPDAVEPAALVKTNKNSSHSRPAPYEDSSDECNKGSVEHKNSDKKDKCDQTDDENQKAKVSKKQDLDVPLAAKKKRTDRLPSTESKSKIAAFLPARQLWKWFGKSTKRPGMKGKAKKEFYKAINRGKETIWIGDCAVFLSTGRPHLPYVGKIESLWESWGGNKVVKVKWFYHPEETKGGRRLSDTKGALYSSPHVDENDVQTISHKCEVLSWEEYKIRKSDGRQNSVFDNDDVYYLAGTYDPGVGMVTSECDLN